MSIVDEQNPIFHAYRDVCDDEFAVQLLTNSLNISMGDDKLLYALAKAYAAAIRELPEGKVF